jgi:5'-nucleotidase
MIILVDMDGPLADYEKGFLDIWREKFSDLDFIKLEDRREFYLHHDYPKEMSENIRSICSAPGFFLNLPAMAGAREAIEEMKNKGHEVFICTSPMNEYTNCVLEKYQWVEKNLGLEWTKKLILTKDKTLVQGSILIDDRPIIHGAGQPTWEHILFDMPYNRDVDLKQRRLTWGNWREVLGM